MLPNLLLRPMAVGDRMAKQATFSVGDLVRWKTGEDSTYGKVIEKSSSKTLSSNQGDYSLEGEEGNPVYKTAVYGYDDDAGDWTENVSDGTREETVHRGSELTKIDSFPDNPS